MQLLLLLITLSVASSCRKAEPVEPSNTTEVYGRVLLRGTNHKATDKVCTIKVYHVVPVGNSFFHMSNVLIAEGVTDTNGNYRFSFEVPKVSPNEIYFLRLETEIENHFRPNAHDYIIKPGESQQLNLEYVPFAWIKLHVRNVNPNVGDNLTVRIGQDQVYEFWGPADRYIYLQTAGNNVSRPTAELYRNGVWSNPYIEVYLPAFDTIYHLLEY